MCGRLAQIRAEQKYLASLMLQGQLLLSPSAEPINRYNVAPHSRVGLLRQVSQGRYLWAPERWRWLPAWVEKPVRNDFNATREKVASSPFYRQVWPHRALLCVDGWYEWCPVEGQKTKQPYYIRRQDSEPLFLPAVGQFSEPDQEPKPDDGFRIITADSEGGMLDVHDRRPVVFDAKSARAWISDISLEDAGHMLYKQALPVEEFHWYAVGPEVGNYRNEGAGLIEPASPSN
ncbi:MULTISPECIES: SOS response-associated peptidase family protein [unclassified Pseudomonas]|uniref:SOS response-associated peptidase family protein n=1 Tax=unclassified Pseudomonas TaxID=196821 RepID=UPI0024498107|nr:MULTISPECIES: SOS response-associated peptidase family protein [unclassified Pseudomonas]MDG9922414.1 SOS response-associated peptidase family protein [Pseudomonas sp. GD04045]MDH0034388.1 SOS response-associated peptidase family protein [Pseudomonas sp. GD04019]